MNPKKCLLVFVCFVLTFCVFTKTPFSNAYNEARIAETNVKSLYKILSSKILTMTMRLNQTQDKISKLSSELAILKQMKHLLEKLNKNTPCEHEYLLLDYRYKQAISIEAKTELPADYTISLKVDHKSLVNKNQADKSGQDLRVFYLPSNSDTPIELDRLVTNPNTVNTVIRFRLQKPIPGGLVDVKSYSLLFGGKHNQQPKADPNKVLALYERFTTPASLRDWSQVWGEWNVKNGRLFGKTGTSAHGSGEVGLYFNHGRQWKDVEIELDLMETGDGVVFPGPFFRVKDSHLQHTTAWWFEYYTDHKECTMRPFQDNKDGSWKYKFNLPEKFAKNKWYHFKYRLQGNNIKQWVSATKIQDANVDKEWMISQGTIALGCHTIYSGSKFGCRTYYDNIKIKLLTKTRPNVTVGKACNIAYHAKTKPIGTKHSPASSCKEIKNAAHDFKEKTPQNGLYWIKTDASGKAAYQTYCDMTQGGWTLVGKIRGRAGNIYKTWLVQNTNTDLLKSTKITSGDPKYGCLDARLLAVKHSSEIMFSSGDNPSGIGKKWVYWQLSTGRDTSTFWSHVVGYNTVKAAPTSKVTVKAWNGQTKVCYQNKYGIMPLQPHGGSYPYTSYNKQGNTNTNDYCMAVGVLSKGSSADGWSQNANGYDSPQSDSDWPNSSYNHQQPYLLVWLK